MENHHAINGCLPSISMGNDPWLSPPIFDFSEAPQVGHPLHRHRAARCARTEQLPFGPGAKETAEGCSDLPVPTIAQWEFQDPKMEVLYHCTIFLDIFLWGYSLKFRPEKLAIE